jgi:hypothetical protein
MTTTQILELVIAAALLGAGFWLYRRPQGQDPAPDSYGSQGAVLLFAIAAILVVHVIITARAFPSDATVEVNQ